MHKKIETAYASLIKLLNRSTKKAFIVIREATKHQRLPIHTRPIELNKDIFGNDRLAGGQNTDGSVKLNMSIRSDNKALFSRYLVTRREEVSTRSYFLFLVLTTYVMVASAFAVGYWFIKMNTTVKTEILQKAKIMDTASWGVWAVNSFTTIIDTKRLVYEEIIPIDFFADWGIPDLLDNCNQQKGLYWHMLLIYSGSVDVEMSMLKLSSFKPLTALGETVSYSLLQPSLQDPSPAALKNRSFQALSGLQYIQPYINEIIWDSLLQR